MSESREHSLEDAPQESSVETESAASVASAAAMAEMATTAATATTGELDDSTSPAAGTSRWNLTTCWRIGILLLIALQWGAWFYSRRPREEPVREGDVWLLLTKGNTYESVNVQIPAGSQVGDLLDTPGLREKLSLEPAGSSSPLTCVVHADVTFAQVRRVLSIAAEEAGARPDARLRLVVRNSHSE